MSFDRNGNETKKQHRVEMRCLYEPFGTISCSLGSWLHRSCSGEKESETETTGEREEGRKVSFEVDSLLPSLPPSPFPLPSPCFNVGWYVREP